MTKLLTKTHGYGFNLIELVIVVAIVSILAAVAFPSYQESVRKSNRTEGQSALLEAISRMERYFYNENTYTIDLTQLGYASAAAVASPDGHYMLSVLAASDACPIVNCVTIEAVAINSQIPDGNLSINSLGQKLPINKW